MDYMHQILSADCSGTMFNVCERLVRAFRVNTKFYLQSKTP